jgi:two-component sensor histidine kinase
MQRSTVSDASALRALDEMQARILAIAGVHKRLYSSPDVPAVDLEPYLVGLVEELRSAMTAWGSQHEIKLTTAPIMLPPDKAVSLGIIVTELVTNAYKYAYADGQRGDIRVQMTRNGDEGCLSVEDDGVGWLASGTVQGTGLGTKVIKSMSMRLGAELTYAPAESGTRAVLCFTI